jgi:glycosyltransferase involved in cell wall biosynthesis
MTVDVIVPYSSDYTPEWMLERLREDVEAQSVNTNLIVIDETEADDVATARNLGLDRSDNRFVAFADADDRWQESKLEKQLENIKTTGTALCLTQTVSDGEMNTHPADDVDQFVADVVLRRTSSFTSSMLLDTQQTSVCFDEDIYRREDHLFAIDAAADGGVCFVDEPLVTVEKHPGGLSHTGEPDRQIEPHQRLFDRGRELLPEIEAEENKYWAEIYHRTGRSYYYDGAYQKSLTYLVQSVLQKPRLKSIGAIAVSAAYLAKSRAPV